METLDVIGEIEDVTPVNDSICVVRTVATKQIVVCGTSVGSTHVFVDVKGSARDLVLKVEVVPNRLSLAKMENVIAVTFPGSQVKLVANDLNDKVLVRGTVASVNLANSILKFIAGPNLRSENLINELRVPTYYAPVQHCCSTRSNRRPLLRIRN